jgi:hypothetical protein
LARCIDVKDQVAPPLSVEDAANAFCCPSFSEAMLFEERAERFQTRAVHIGQEATQTRAVWQRSTSKQSHEGRFEGRYPLKEVRQRPFPADGIADQHCEKIDGLIAAEASSDQAHLLRKSFQQPLRLQVPGNDDHFREPIRHRSTINRRGLDLNTPIGYHMLFFSATLLY